MTPTKGDIPDMSVTDIATARDIAHRQNGISGPVLAYAIAAALTAARQEEREAIVAHMEAIASDWRVDGQNQKADAVVYLLRFIRARTTGGE